MDLSAMISGLSLSGMGGGKRLILAVGEEAVVLTLVNGRRVVDAWVAAPQPADGKADILEALNRHKRVPVHVLIDTFEQQFREEKVPKVNIMDQPKVVDRHLKAAFPGNNLLGAVPSGSDPQGNRYYLFASVPPTEELKGWLKVLEEAGRRPKSIHSLPLEAVDMLMALCPPATVRGVRWRMLFTFDLAGGLRQLVTKQHRIMLTRLTPPPPPDSPIDPVSIIDRDFQQTLAYVKRMGYQKGDHLDLVVLAEEPLKSQLLNLEWEAHSTTVMTPTEAGIPLRLSNVGREGQPYADVLHAAWFATKRKPSLPLRWSSAVRVDALAILNAAAPPLAMASAVGVVVTIAVQMNQLNDLQDRMDGVTSQRNAASVQLARESARLKELPYTPEEVRTVLTLAEELDRRRVDPQALFAALGQGLATSGAIVHRLEMSASDPAPFVQRGGNNRNRGKAPVDGPVYSMDLELLMPPSVQTDAAALALADRLETQLADAFSDAAVSTLEPPVTIEHDQSLTAEMQLTPVVTPGAVNRLTGQPLPPFLAAPPGSAKPYRVVYQIVKEAP